MRCFKYVALILCCLVFAEAGVPVLVCFSFFLGGGKGAFYSREGAPEKCNNATRRSSAACVTCAALLLCLLDPARVHFRRNASARAASWPTQSRRLILQVCIYWLPVGIAVITSDSSHGKGRVLR